MDRTTPKATSVVQSGEPDDFAIGTGFWDERDWGGTARLVVSVPPERLAEVHHALLGVLGSPLGVLYRQLVDRREPRPEGAPSRDFVALEIGPSRVMSGLASAADLVYHDARHELWVRGPHADQVVLDADGLLYCYPDDPAFRDVLAAAGIPEEKVEAMSTRDYVKHWFHAECDAQEDALIAGLELTEVAPQRHG